MLISLFHLMRGFPSANLHGQIGGSRMYGES